MRSITLPASGSATCRSASRTSSEPPPACPTKSRLMVSDAGTMFTECTAGTGIAQVAAVVVRDLLENGSLIQLFPDWSDETFPLYAYHPSRHHPAAKVRAFVDFVLDAVH